MQDEIITKSKSKIVYHELPIDDPMVRRPDISKAVRMINWKPAVSFEDGMKMTINWFRNSC